MVCLTASLGPIIDTLTIVVMVMVVALPALYEEGCDGFVTVTNHETGGGKLLLILACFQ